MIDWLLSHYPYFLRASRWLIVCCGAALMSLASLPHTAVNRIIAIIGLGVIAIVFALWLAIVLVTILRPRLFDELRRKRAGKTRRGRQ